VDLGGEQLTQALHGEGVKLLVSHAAPAEGKHCLPLHLVNKAAGVGVSAGITVGGLDVHGGSPSVMNILLSIQARMSSVIASPPGQQHFVEGGSLCQGSTDEPEALCRLDRIPLQDNMLVP
jgi:hypothetical protein